MNCPNCGSVRNPHESHEFGDWFSCGSLGDSTTHLCRSLRDDCLRIALKIGACAGDHIPDATKMVETLRAELAESKAMIWRLQAENRRITEWFRRLEDAGDAINDCIGCGCGGDRGLCSKCSQASENWGNTKETSHE